MKQWNGLLKKEWILMKWPLLAMVIIGIAVLTVFPFLFIRTFGLDVHFYEITLVMSFLWALAGTLVPMGTLLVLLEREMKRPDIWLHSTASIFKLIGSKMVFAALIGVVSFLIPTLVLAVEYNFINLPIFMMGDMFRFGVWFLITLFYASVAVMGFGFFLWVLYRLLKQVIRGFAVPATLLLFVFFIWLAARVGQTELYERIVQVGKVDLSKVATLQTPAGESYESGHSLFYTAEFYTGELVLDVLLMLAMFIGGAVLFEKKIRL